MHAVRAGARPGIMVSGQTQWNAVPDYATRRVRSGDPRRRSTRAAAGARRRTIAGAVRRRAPVACSRSALLAVRSARRRRRRPAAGRRRSLEAGSSRRMRVRSPARPRRRWRPVRRGHENGRDQPDAGVHAIRSDRGRAAPRDRADVRRRPGAVHAAGPGDPRARARARDVLRGRRSWSGTSTPRPPRSPPTAT